VLDQAQNSEPVSTPLLDGVRALRLRYLDRNREWSDQWPPQDLTGAQPSASAAPPLAVELTLETERDGELVFLFRLGLDVLPTGFPASAPPSGQQDTPGTPDDEETVPTP
jgi:general secretion pathway protein J